MKLSRQQCLGTALLLTMALAGWTAWNDNSGIAEASTSRNAAATGMPIAQPVAYTSGPVPNANDGRLNRDPLLEPEADPFRVVSFVPPPPKASEPPPPPPPKPTAPPFPYRYFGRMVDVDGKPVTYLARGNELIPVQETQVLDQAYRIDSVSDTRIMVTYLPLDEKAAIAVQSAQH